MPDARLNCHAGTELITISINVFMAAGRSSLSVRDDRRLDINDHRGSERRYIKRVVDTYSLFNQQRCSLFAISAVSTIASSCGWPAEGMGVIIAERRQCQRRK